MTRNSRPKIRSRNSRPLSGAETYPRRSGAETYARRSGTETHARRSVAETHPRRSGAETHPRISGVKTYAWRSGASGSLCVIDRLSAMGIYSYHCLSMLVNDLPGQKPSALSIFVCHWFPPGTNVRRSDRPGQKTEKKENKTWDRLVTVVRGHLSNQKTKNYKELLKDLVKNYGKLDCRVSKKGYIFDTRFD